MPERGRYGTVPGLPEAAEPPRRFTTTRFRADGVDYRLHAFLIDVPAPDAEPTYQTAPSIDDPRPAPPRAVPLARQITSGDVDHTALCFAPDGASVIVIAARHTGRDRDLRTDLCASISRAVLR